MNLVCRSKFVAIQLMAVKKSQMKLKLLYALITIFAVFLFITHFFDSSSNSDISLSQRSHIDITDKSVLNHSVSVLSQQPHAHPRTKTKVKLSPVLRGKSCTKDKAFLRLKNVIRPPNINGVEFTQEVHSFWRHMNSSENQLAANHLSTIVQKQIDQIQGKSCDEANLQCGQQDHCGFGCQIHHRIACLMMSYVTKLPLIHTPDCDGWPYTQKWSDIFEPLGSSCAPGNNTIVWKWNDKYQDCDDTSSTKTIPYPLTYGIPLDAELGNMIETITPEPFPWLVGQFAKYVMKLNPSFVRKLQEWKTEIGFDNTKTPIVGIHVRLTDKILEAADSRHAITDYMDEAEKYFQRVESSKGLTKNALHRRLFLASDNSSTFAETVKMYPNWEILGFSSKFSEKFIERRNGLFEIVRDIELLSQTDFVVCGFSSNVCRLIYEMQASSAPDQNQSGDEQSISISKKKDRLKSLDGFYYYPLWNRHSFAPNYNMKIWKMNCSRLEDP